MRNPDKMCSWDDQGHRICDQDLSCDTFSLKKLRRRADGIFNEIYNWIVILMYACGIANRDKKE